MKLTRRNFMSSAAAAGAAFTIVPSHVLGGTKYIAPSEKLNIAAIGSGGKGFDNINACSKENIVALCDVDYARAARTFEKYPNAKRFKDFRVMLDEMDKDIDAVIVATPDHTHAVAAMKSMKMGKHVYCQKPLTHTVYEARKLTETAREMGVATQMGNQGHSGSGCRRITEWIADGAIGDVREVHCWTNRPVWPQGILRPTDTPPIPKDLDWDLWLGPAPVRPYNPAYLPFNWRAWYDFGCGALGDMACHIMDAAYMALDLKYPTSVQASRGEQVQEMWKRVENNETYPNASVVHYSFPARGEMPPVKVHWYDGGILPEIPEELGSRGLGDSGTIFVGDKGKIVSYTYGNDPMLLPSSLHKSYKQPEPTIKRIKGSHEQNWIDACKGGDPACSNFDYSGPFTEMVVMGNFAIRMPGKLLMWDGPNMKVTNNEAANALVHKEYRKGWTL
ncbi:MAG: Gfo/Idh/MocA family oxidoreductase [Phycisphaerae bacterium]|nr:Gfo/Idh/MocA family oxidoreductase [Phycisphaerae bacterium]